jgi:TRAP-type C4-dicarboxylate transport system permease small subunit
MSASCGEGKKKKSARETLHSIMYTVNIVFLALLTVTIFVTVLLRYIFKVAVPEATILQRFAVAWLVFLGAAIAVWDDQHLKIDIFGPYISERGKKIQRIVIDILMLAAVVLLVLAGIRAFQIGLYRTELIEIRFLKNRIRLTYINSAFLTGSALMLIFHLLNLVDRYILGGGKRAQEENR